MQLGVVDAFLKQYHQKVGARATLIVGPVRLYVRIAARRLGSTFATLTLDLADIEVDESERSRGCFTALLPEIESLATQYKLTVYVESIANERLIKFLELRGYVTDSNTVAPNAWLLRKSPD
jgi:GNAT superfamily N-acetyltransferase